MSSLLFIMVFIGLIRDARTGTGIFNNQSDECPRFLSSNSPLLNRFVKGSVKNYLPSFPTTSAVDLINVLQWDKVIIFFDQHYRDEVQSILPTIELASVYELQTTAGVKEKLLQLYRTLYPKLHFLLLLKNSLTQAILHIADQFDLGSNRTTDFCHFSFWIAVHQGQVEPGDLPLLQHLENVAFIVFHEKLTCDELRQLLPTLGGRVFSPGRKLSEFKTKEDVFPNIRHGLNNRRLIVSTLEDPPFVITTRKGYGGYCFDIIDAIATYLNFRYEVVNPGDRKWGELIDGQWNGLIGQLANREVDLVVAPITIHEDREKVMDFIYPPIFKKVDDIFYKLQPKKEGAWYIHLGLFTSTVLLLLLLTLLVSTLAVFLLFRYEHDIVGLSRTDDSTRRSPLYYYMLLSEILIYLFGILLNRGLQSNPRNHSTRMLLFTWGMFSVLIAACYSAVMVSNFTVQKPKIPFRNLKELVSQTEYKWGFTSGHIRERIIKSSKSDDLKMVWKGVLEFNKTDPQVLSKDHEIHLAKMRAEKYAFIATRYRMYNTRPYDCNVRSVGEDVLWEQYAIGVPSNYPLTEILEQALASIADSGLLDIWWRRNWVKEKLDCDPDNKLEALKIQEFVSVFFLLCCGIGTSFVVLVLEKIKHKLQ